MSYELLKIQSDEGYSYQPGANKHIHFKFNEPNVLDMDKSYVVLNTSLNLTANAATRTACNTVTGGNTNLDFIVNPALAPYGDGGTIDYKPICMLRNAKFSSNSVKDMYVENREVNIREHNKQLYTKSLGEHQKETLFGAGWSRLDARTNEVKTSAFLNKVIGAEGAELSSYNTVDCIVPLSELLGDVGKMALYPSGLMDTQTLELEIEDRYNLVDVANLYNPIELAYLPADLPVMDDTSATLKTFNFNSRGETLSNNALTNSNIPGDNMWYVGMPVKIELSSNATPSVTTTNFAIITGVTSNPPTGDPTDIDAFNTDNEDDVLQITVNKSFGQMFNYQTAAAAPTKTLKSIKFVPLTLSEMLGTNVPSYTINRAELVLARRRLSPQLVQQYYSALLKEGMKFGVWDTIAWNRNSTSEVSEFWTLPANSYAFMNLTPQGVLYSLVNNMTGYRVAVNDVETTNRDVTMTQSITSSLYKHKVISTIGACNELVNSLEPSVTKSMNGLDGGSCVAYPLDIVPYTEDRVLLKLTIKSTTANMPVGVSYLFVKHDKVINFN
jgi:hypothetical protein